MQQRGLTTSIWANRDRNDGQCESYPRDWACATCGFSNFEWRKQCLRCSRAKVPDFSTIALEVSTTSIDQSPINSLRNSEKQDIAPTIRRRTAEHGLSTSRWAPRPNGTSKIADTRAVWTKLAPPVPADVYCAPSHVLDLGLPYEVQHYILVTMQRILEEGCFDFAVRWIPNVLSQSNYSCAEAVELSTWKQLLPTTVPGNAIKPVTNHTLEMALGRAVRIRNSAVHRHLCDNHEIRQMALQAQDLMSIFSDSSRATKFRLLQEALYDWDSTSLNDPEKSRADLEQALRDISERPVDNMDWTPNSVSLQEVTSDPASQEWCEGTKDHIDEMEID